MTVTVWTTTLVLGLTLLARPSHERDVYHSTMTADWRGAPPSGGSPRSEALPGEATPAHWAHTARIALERRLAPAPPPRPARNVVMFLGDGMSVPTLAAARTLLGQRAGQPGEETQLYFETFPTTGFVKTYCLDAQTADSACSATAYLCGVKANLGTLGVSGAVPRGHCDPSLEAHHVPSLAEWALADGRDAGIVTTTRVTHASPAGAYSHSAHRDWESDADVGGGGGQGGPTGGHRAAARAPPPRGPLQGGGRREFLPASVVDEEGTPGRRLDGRNLIEEWQADKRARNVTHRYVWNREQLMDASTELPEYLLGLFEGSHMQYHMQANPVTEPTLAELTEVAIRSLSRNERGFFLFVEGGRIDHAHHENRARLALDETIELSEAVRRAAALVSATDSLVVVTADHAHVMTLSGYAARGSDVSGPSGDLARDDVPYMTLSYANGPGYRDRTDQGLREDLTQQDYREIVSLHPTPEMEGPLKKLATRASETLGSNSNRRRPLNPKKANNDSSTGRESLNQFILLLLKRRVSDTDDADFQYDAMVPLDSETHGGDDVAVFARGPYHHLFSGLYEQSHLPHLMGYAACLGPGLTACSET